MYKTVSLSCIGFKQIKNLKDETKSYDDVMACDMEELSNRIETVCNEQEKEGYKVVSITPIIRGRYTPNKKQAYSKTEGVIILFKK